MSELSVKLKKARIENNLSQKQVSELTGIGYRTINDYENGKSRPDVEKLALLCSLYKTSADHFINVKADPDNHITISETSLIKKYRALDHHGKEVVNNIIELELKRINKYKAAENTRRPDEPHVYRYQYAYDLSASAGTGIPALDIAHFETIELSSPAPSGTDFIIKVSGDSMEPIYSDGDKLCISRCKSLNIGEIGLFYVAGDIYVKELGNDELISLNKEYSAIKIDEFTRCFGKVIGKIEHCY